MKIKSKVWLEKNNNLVFGSGRFLLLSAINSSGSINKAAKELKMSYRRAWSYINSAEKHLGRRLIIRKKGGLSGGGAVLTAFAIDMLIKFIKLNCDVEEFVNKRYKQIFKK